MMSMYIMYYAKNTEHNLSNLLTHVKQTYYYFLDTKYISITVSSQTVSVRLV